jgi:predicted transcriptional regulator
MKVRDRMKPSFHIIPEKMNLKSALQVMKKYNTGVLLVKKKYHLSGLLTASQILLKSSIDKFDLSKLQVRQMMNKKMYFCYQDQDISQARSLMDAKQLRYLIVLDRENKIVGLFYR